MTPGKHARLYKTIAFNRLLGIPSRIKCATTGGICGVGKVATKLCNRVSVTENTVTIRAAEVTA